jgi:hypothetical protein
MAQIWNGGTIDVLALPHGTFISPKLTKKRVELARNNSVYREALEKASKMAGYVDPALSLARGRVQKSKSLFKQNEKAEKLLKEKRKNEKTGDSDTDII